jgi:4-amino-4-deoxy-L-arabinose transferase-like glycosyltransferase
MPRSLFWLALLCHMVLALGYARTTPSFEGPDESDHYAYAWHVGNARSLPLAPALVATRGLPQTDGAALAHHPPLYYALLGAALVASGRDDTVFGPRINPAFGVPEQPSRHLKYLHGSGQGDSTLWLLRCVSVLLGALTLFCVHRLGRALCPAQPRIADLAALLVAGLPMFSFLHGVLNNDVLATTLATATTLALVRVLQAEALRITHGVSLGVLLGLSLLTKLTTLFLLPLAAVVFVVVLVRARANGQVARTVAIGALAVAIATALSGWWFVRNAQLYGDPLALTVHDMAFQPIPPELRWAWWSGTFLPDVFVSLLGCFGWFSLRPHALLVGVGIGVTAIALLGLTLALRTHERRGEVPCAPRASWLLLLSLLLVFAGAAKFNWTAPQPQARLLFPAIGPAAVLLAAGLVRLAPRARWRRWLLALPIATASVVFVAWFRPAFDPQLAPAPANHRALTGGIVHVPAGVPTAITWREPLPTSPATTPPVLHWRDDGAPAGTRYSLYAFDGTGRVWLASHEWGGDGLVLTGDRTELHPAAWGLLPVGVDLSFALRRVPTTADEDPATMPRSAPLPFRRQ